MTFHWHDAHAQARKLTDRIADAVAAVACSFNAFLVAAMVVIVWGATGPHYGYSDTWQLIINTGTTIVTFLMAFLIGANQIRQAERDRLHAEADYQVNLAAESRIEALQVQIARLEIEKMDHIISLLEARNEAL